MVKPVSACASIEICPYTDVFGDSVDFATDILRAVNGFDSIPVAATREDALNMILENTSTHRLSTVAVLGNTSGLDHKYDEGSKSIVTRIQSRRRRIRRSMNLTVCVAAINGWNRVAISFRAVHPTHWKGAA